MILNTLQLKNYKQYTHLELQFREGLVGIIGKNGAGKSTIFEAILYCLFGRDEGNKAHIRSVLADVKANVELQLEFMMGETAYRVKREFRGKTLTVVAEFYKNDVLVAKGVSPVNEEIARVLHMERDAFKRSVFSGQKELSELSDTSGEARKRMVRRMLGLDTLDDMQSRINSDLRELGSQAAGQRQNLLDETATEALKKEMAERDKALTINTKEAKLEAKKLQEIQKQYETEKKKFDKEEARYKKFNALKQDQGQAEERRSGLSAQIAQLKEKELEIQRLKSRLDASKADFSRYESDKKQLEHLENERSRHVNREARLNKIQESKAQIEGLDQEIKRLSQELARHADVEKTLREAQQKVETLEAAMEAKRSELRKTDQDIGGIQAGLKERREKLENLRALGREGNCPTCLQPLLEGYERALDELNAEIQRLQTERLAHFEAEKKRITDEGLGLKNQQTLARAEVEKYSREQTRLAELERQKHGASLQHEQLDKRLVADEAILQEIGPVHFDEATYLQLKARISELEPRYREFLAQENYVARELPATLTAQENAIKNLEATAKSLEKIAVEFQELHFEEEVYNTAREAVASFTESYRIQAEALRALEKAGLELQNEQSRATERLQQNERILALISDKLEEVELLRKLTEMLGLFKTEILEKVSPGISAEASELFSRITRGKYEGIRVDENFDFYIMDGGVFYPIDRFSGGEIDLANFCLRIAITKAIMDLSGAASDRRLEFLAFDEIFGSQDEERRLEMMLALNYLQEQFRQIYIVSHIDSLKDFFPHLLEIQHTAEGSAAIWR